MTCWMAGENRDESPEEASADNRQDRKLIFQNLKWIHSAAGHCSLEYLKRTPKKRGAPRNVMRCAAKFHVMYVMNVGALPLVHSPVWSRLPPQSGQ